MLWTKYTLSTEGTTKSDNKLAINPTQRNTLHLQEAERQSLKQEEESSKKITLQPIFPQSVTTLHLPLPLSLKSKGLA
jgi:hypothetical protein